MLPIMVMRSVRGDERWTTNGCLLVSPHIGNTSKSEAHDGEFMNQDDRKAPALVDVPPATTRRGELLTFLVLAFGIWPVVAVGVVGGYGFLVWMYQIVFGPPGPPGG